MNYKFCDRVAEVWNSSSKNIKYFKNVQDELFQSIKFALHFSFNLKIKLNSTQNVYKYTP